VDAIGAAYSSLAISIRWGGFFRQFELCDAHAGRLAIRDHARGIVVSDQRD
jgi:hypothetical protein